MNTRRVKKHFRKWLEENKHHFNHKPYPKDGVYTEFYFEGISKNISLVMNYHAPEAMIYHRNPLNPEECCNHDVVACLGDEQYDKAKGYYNGYSEDGTYRYFATQEALYADAVFKWIIAYVNEKFVEENTLYLDDCDSFIESKKLMEIRHTKRKNKECFDLFTGEQLPDKEKQCENNNYEA